MTDWEMFLEPALEAFQEAIPNKCFAIVDGIIKPITPWVGDDVE